jgi:hypothetical protein
MLVAELTSWKNRTDHRWSAALASSGTPTDSPGSSGQCRPSLCACRFGGPRAWSSPGRSVIFAPGSPRRVRAPIRRGWGAASVRDMDRHMTGRVPSSLAAARLSVPPAPVSSAPASQWPTCPRRRPSPLRPSSGGRVLGDRQRDRCRRRSRDGAAVRSPRDRRDQRQRRHAGQGARRHRTRRVAAGAQDQSRRDVPLHAYRDRRYVERRRRWSDPNREPPRQHHLFRVTPGWPAGGTVSDKGARVSLSRCYLLSIGRGIGPTMNA